MNLILYGALRSLPLVGAGSVPPLTQFAYTLHRRDVLKELDRIRVHFKPSAKLHLTGSTVQPLEDEETARRGDVAFA